MSVQKNIKKNERKIRSVCIQFNYDVGGVSRTLVVRPIVGEVENWIDEPNNVFVMFSPVNAHEEYMIESGNFGDYWNDDMRENVCEELEQVGASDCWEINDEVMDLFRHDAPRTKVYYIENTDREVMEIEDMLWYKWMIPIKKIHSQD